jgi:drug/metabolite transporter (DMT)-like permease
MTERKMSMISPRLAHRMHFVQSRLDWRVTRRLLSRRGLGVFLVLASAASFGAVTPFARLAYEAGVSVVTVMAVRYTLAGLAVTGYLVWRRQAWRLSGRQLWLTLGLALFLGVMSFAYLGSVRYIPVSLAALIYFTYPILVTVLAYLTGSGKLHNRDRGAHLIAFGGQVVSLAGLVLLLRLSRSALNPIGVLMAAFSAIGFALVLVFGSRLMRTVSPMVLNLYVALVNAALFALAGVLGASFAWPTLAAGWIGLLGVSVFFVAGFMGLFVGVSMISPGRAACLSNVEPVVTIALSVLLLGEPFGAWQLVGGGAVLIGIFIMCRNVMSEGDREPRQLVKPPGKTNRVLNCTPECRRGSRCVLVDP